jgi:ABC-type Fe3+-hydroxamate transport system substrate-binding protein
MRYIALIAAVALIVLAAGCTAPSAPQTGTPTPAATVTTVGTTGPAVSIAAGVARIANVGGNATVPIILAQAPNGISGYNVTVVLSDPSVGEIAAVAFPDWAGMKSASTVPAGMVALQAVDMSMKVPVGATNVTLATLTVTGRAAGTAAITVRPDPVLGVQDRSGDLYTVTVSPGSLTVGA